MKYQHLNVALNPSANTNRRNLNAFGNHLRDLARDQFEHDRKRAGCFQCIRVIQQLPGGISRLALHAIRAKLIDRLRRQTDMAHHRDFFVH